MMRGLIFFLGLTIMANHTMASEKLKLCPNKPNCVSSLQGEDASRQVETLPLIVDIATSRKVLIDIVEQMSRTKKITEEVNYLHFTFTSLIFRFVDDVEISFNPETNTIDVRSASRTGHSDFGVNRRRIEEIRKLYLEKKKEFKVAKNSTYDHT